MTELEIAIGYEFKDKALLQQALTHSSYSNERQQSGDNERLEFLGDSVLGFISAEFFFMNMKNKPEGELTRCRAAEVCEKSLAEFARSIDLGKHLLLGKGESMTGGRDRPSILSDAFEALIAAIYIDGGMQRAKQFVLKFLSLGDLSDVDVRDCKTILQEVIQRNPEERLDYVLVAESGPAHDRLFEVEVRLNSNIIGSGVGRSKKKAEQAAAAEALKLMGIKH